MFDDEDIAGLKAVASQRLQEFFGERIAGADFISEGDGDQAKLRRRCNFLSPLRS
jgi:hypothetical protein